MKLSTPCKKVGEISASLKQSYLDKIQPEDWNRVDDMRKEMFTDPSINSIVLRHFESYYWQDKASWRDHIVNKALFERFKDEIELTLSLIGSIYEGYEDYIIFLARILPGGEVEQHEDTNPFLETCHRIHIPLRTNPDVIYSIQGSNYHWEEGKIYEFNNMLPHGCKNSSNQERIHLIINLYK